jgi:hypothetical protein
MATADLQEFDRRTQRCLNDATSLRITSAPGGSESNTSRKDDPARNWKASNFIEEYLSK